jgi:hypothetical protein
VNGTFLERVVSKKARNLALDVPALAHRFATDGTRQRRLRILHVDPFRQYVNLRIVLCFLIRYALPEISKAENILAGTSVGSANTLSCYGLH